MKKELLKYIETQLGNETIITGYQQVFGGDINKTFILQTNKSKLFCKINDAVRQDMFKKEFNGLQLLRSANSIVVPKPILYGNYDDHIFLVMDSIEKGNILADSWKNFAYNLAGLHKNTNQFFGLNENNYIGTISQLNTPCNTWAAFYGTQRILPLMQKALQQHNCSIEDVKRAELVCQRLTTIFPDEPPSLLHGDLWNGNFMIGKDGIAVIYDPAVYYGHREMDIAMTMLFGGFDASFYDHYNDVYPLEKNWRQRIELCQLYPLLVHLLLFGGHYYYDVKNILTKYS